MSPRHRRGALDAENGTAAIRVKICGLTRPQDVEASLAAGADFLGVVLCESPRRRTLEQAAALIEHARSIDDDARVIGVIQDPDDEDLKETIGAGFWGLQLHGEESPERVGEIRGQHPKVYFWKALRLRGAGDLRRIPSYPTNAVVLDAWSAERAGGTGRRAPVPAADLAAAARRARIVLAGGLTPENVDDAVHDVQPWAVDVSTGVERSAGVKDPKKIQAFVARARAAAEDGS